MPWFRVVGGRLRYRRLTRAPFLQWLATPDGHRRLAIEEAQVRFPVFGRHRMARARLWREMKGLAADARVQAIVAEQADHYLSLLTEFAFADGVPRTMVDLRRLVVVPRLPLNVRALAAMKERLATLPGGNGAGAGTALRDFFALTLVAEMDRALVAARPGIRRPLPAAEGWASIGMDTALVWVQPYWVGRGWEGHHFLYEQPRDRLTRRQRKRVETAIRQLTASLGASSRAERYEMVRCATASVKA